MPRIAILQLGTGLRAAAHLSKPSINHCGFTTAEQVRAFDDLVNWVENGVKPAGDPILDPAAVAAPTFGCAFTQGTNITRSNLPACP